MRTLLYTTAVALLLTFAACDTLVEDVDDPINTASDEALNSADQVDFLISGVEGRFASTHDRTGLFTSILSDQFIFGGSGATFPTYRQLDEADINLDNNSVDGSLVQLGEYRFLADELLRRAEAIDGLSPAEGGWPEGEADPARARMFFKAHFHGALARYFWAAFYGRDAQEGGGVISELDSPEDTQRGEFVPSDELYQRATDRLEEEALPRAANFLGEGQGYDSRVIHTILARIALFQGDLDAARSYAESGLSEGDAPFQAQYLDRTGGGANFWFDAGGPGRVQTLAAPRFFNGDDYLNEDLEAAEANRIPVVPNFDGDGNLLGHRQGLYNERGAAIDFATWQENELILAEIELREGSGDPLARINAVRASHGLDDLAEATLDVLFTERDKELFTLGYRLVDQRRITEQGIDVDEDLHGWHRDADAWWYLPITLAERNDNPNF
ncbi:MAG: hypothetical protein PPP56_12920 [Longimonas sp.]|uniref:hypothetical protein n=1 Tax=Longimonas sp. TaxID=2039626 RepID=UPI00335C5B8C